MTVAPAKRKKVSKKTRFEVFKRDSFTCQYCGQKAPDVLLAVDHIAPVAKGGTNDLLNLITACEPCNNGKGAVELSDQTILAKQREQLAELNARREQLAMMLAWREGMKNLAKEKAEQVETAVLSKLEDGRFLTEDGQRRVRDWLRRFEITEVLDAIDIAADRYLVQREDGTFADESVEKFLGAIPGTAWNSRQPEYVRDLLYIRGIARRRLNYCVDDRALALLKAAYEAGTSIDELKAITLAHTYWSAWRDEIAELGA